MDDVALIQYTGGTTGVAKGVMLTHANLSFQIQQIDAWFPQFAGKDETILGALPFFHSFGLTCSMNNAVFAGWSNILIPSPRPENLLAAGVRIFEYEGGLLHTKSLTLDGEITLIGSANMDRRSFELNYENNTLLYGRPMTAEMRERQASYIASSKPVTLEMVANWTWQ